MHTIDRRTKFTILVAALGYMVDVFDLILFTLLRKPSLESLGVAAADMKSTGVFLLNWQMAGFIIGGILWGVLGDKRGRLSVLLGSILMYSLANIANGFVATVPVYAALRFIAGVGLAGEIGAGVALASELLPQKLRGWGTVIIAVTGLAGAIVAALFAEDMGWRHAYIAGGVMGLLLLVLRLSVRESALFEKTREMAVSRGSLIKFLGTPKLVGKLMLVTLVGIPIWFAIGIIVTFTPELSKAMAMVPAAKVSGAVLWIYIGLAIGGVLIGGLSQFWQSRKRAIYLSLALTASAVIGYANFASTSVSTYYLMIALLGMSVGYWGMFLQVAAEQFGTNYRSTAASSAPNLVRGTTIPMALAFQALGGHFGTLHAAYIVGGVALLIAIIALSFLKETFHRDLDYVEMI